MTDITLTMIDEADDATLMRYQRELAAEAERVANERKAELGRAFTQATRYIAQQADTNGHRRGYIDEAEAAREYMPDWLLPWLPEPSVKAEGMYVAYIDATMPVRPDRDVTPGNYRPQITDDGRIPNTTYAANYGSLADYLRTRLPEDLYQQVTRYVTAPEPSVRTDYRLSQ